MRRLAAVAGMIFSLSAGLGAQVKVEALVSDSRITEGESFTLEIRVENGELRGVQLPPLDDFRRLSGPSTSRSMQIVNGKVTSSSSYKWEFMPRRTGALTIPSFSVTVEGKQFSTQALAIQVSKLSAPQAGVTDRPLFLQIDIEPTDPYLGQQVTVTWTLFTLLNVTGWEVINEPNLSGFWTEELFAPTKLQLHERVYNGRRYYTAVVKRVALFPTRSGDLEIDPMTLRIAVQTRNRRRDPFFDDLSFFGRRSVEQKNISSQAREIQARPLPTQGRPDGFAGVVGVYDLTAELSSASVVQNEAVTLTMAISGEGNIKTVEPPVIDFPAGLEIFDPQSTIEPSLGDILGGTRTLEHIIIPRQPGRFTLPVVRLVYFNPITARYEEKLAGPFTLTVEASNDPAATASGYSREEVALLGSDIRFVKTTEPKWVKNGQGWYSPGLIVLNLFAILLFTVPWIGGKAQGLRTMLMPGLMARRALQKSAGLLGRQGPQGGEVYSNFPRAVTAYLNAKLNRDVQEYTLDETRTILSEHGLSDDTVGNIINLLEKASAARFSRETPDGAAADREALLSALTVGEGQWKG